MAADPHLCHTHFAPFGLTAAGHMLEVVVIEKDTLRLLMMTLMARFEVSHSLWLRVPQGAVKRMWTWAFSKQGMRSFPARRWPRGSCGSSDPLPGRSALSSPAVALESSGRPRNRSGSVATTI